MKKITCKGCGVCCVPMRDQDVFCDINDADYKKLSKAERRHVRRPSLFSMIAEGNRVAIRTKWRKDTKGPFEGYAFNRCYFLKGALLCDAHCSIYDHRPSTCKLAVKPGDKTCKYLRDIYLGKIKDLEREEDKHG